MFNLAEIFTEYYAWGFAKMQVSRIRFMGFCPLAIRGCPSILLTLAPHRLLLHTGLHFPSPIALITQLSPITRSPERHYTHHTKDIHFLTQIAESGPVFNTSQVLAALQSHTRSSAHTHREHTHTHTAVHTHTWSSAHTHREHTHTAVHTHTVNTHTEVHTHPEQCTHTP